MKKLLFFLLALGIFFSFFTTSAFAAFRTLPPAETEPDPILSRTSPGTNIRIKVPIDPNDLKSKDGWTIQIECGFSSGPVNRMQAPQQAGKLASVSGGEYDRLYIDFSVQAQTGTTDCRTEQSDAISLAVRYTQNGNSVDYGKSTYKVLYTINGEPVLFEFHPQAPNTKDEVTMTIQGIPSEKHAYKTSQILGEIGERVFARERDTGFSFNIDGSGACTITLAKGTDAEWTTAPTCSASAPYTITGTFPFPATHHLTYRLILDDNPNFDIDDVTVATQTIINAQDAPQDAPTPNPPPPPCLEGIGANGQLIQNNLVPTPGEPLVTQEPIVKCTKVYTAVGSFATDPIGFIKTLFGFLLSIAGGIAIILIIVAGFRLMTSQGDPEKVKGARETITSAIVGLLFLIFSVTILQIIGVNILHIPGFGQ